MSTSIKGFSLLEIMIALLIFSVGIVGTFQLQQLTMFQEEEVIHTYHALSLAESELERLHAGIAAEVEPAFSSMFSSTSSPVFSNVGDISQREIHSMSATDLQYQLSLSIDRTLFSGDLKQVTIHVAWQDRRRKMHAVSLSTMISRFQ